MPTLSVSTFYFLYKHYTQFNIFSPLAQGFCLVSYTRFMNCRLYLFWQPYLELTWKHCMSDDCFSKLHEWVLFALCKCLASVFCQCKLIRVRYLSQHLPIDILCNDPELEECNFSQNRLEESSWALFSPSILNWQLQQSWEIHLESKLGMPLCHGSEELL